jgi:polar amino acid transport system substrate-binding protein
MRLVRQLVLFCAACLPVLVPQAADRACGKVVLSGDPDYPPFSWYDGRAMRGAAIEIAQKALDHAGIAYEVRYVGPFNRVLQAAKTGSIDLIAELKDTPERRAYLAYSGVAIFNNPVAVFVRGDSKIAFHQWKDLAGLHGGMTLGNKFGGGFDDYLAQSLTVESANSIASNFAKLELGRIDYFVNSYYPALHYLESEHKEAQFKPLHPFVTSSSNFAAWAKGSPCIGYLVELDRILSGMVKSGEAKRTLESNFAHLQDEVAAH